VVLAFVGEESILSGEAHCLADLNLQGAQSDLLAALAKTGKPVVTVVMAGRPLTIEKEVNQSAAVFYYFHPGTMGGPAIADLLFGKEVPSGKTPVTFPKMVGQIPVYYSHNNSGRPATRNEILLNDIPVEAGQTSLGCTSFYMDAGFDPLYPFGYGLSYTTFSYGDIDLSRSTIDMTGELTAAVMVTNTGTWPGSEVVQLYIRDLVGNTTRPVKELKGFQKIFLEPGQSEIVKFKIAPEMLRYYNYDLQLVAEPGEFEVMIGTNSRDVKSARFTLK
jgi:beta-glucosidase